MKTKKYCTVCGSKLKLIPTSQYDPYTGKQVMAAQCSSGKCGHDGCNHEWGGFARSLFFGSRCSKCGYVVGE